MADHPTGDDARVPGPDSRSATPGTGPRAGDAEAYGAAGASGDAGTLGMAGSGESVLGSGDGGVLVPGPALGTLDAAGRRRLVVHAIVRVLAVTAFLLLAYSAVPVGPDTSLSGAVVLAVGLVGFTAALFHQVRRILDSPMPQMRAVETLGTAVPLFIVIFALAYVLMSDADPTQFTQPISKVSGIYFTVTVLATVGFGDITAVSDTARMVVTLQMVIDLILVGLVVKVILGASKIGVERRRAEAEAASRTRTGPPPSDP